MSIKIETQMLIRCPVAEVYQAFIDPAVTVKFWFSSASGPLQQGHTVEWHWQKYQVSATVEVIQLIENALIQIRWGEPKSTVNFTFQAIAADQTYVTISNEDITLQGDELIAFIIDSTGGFSTVLDGLKAWMEHRLQLNLVEDKFPPF